MSRTRDGVAPTGPMGLSPQSGVRSTLSPTIEKLWVAVLKRELEIPPVHLEITLNKYSASQAILICLQKADCDARRIYGA